MKLEIYVSPIDINLNCRNVNADDFIYKQLAKLNFSMEKMMGKLEDTVALVETKMSEQATSLSRISTSLAGVAGDIAALKAGLGGLTPEQELLLDSVVTKVTAGADGVKAAADALEALDLENPPKAP